MNEILGVSVALALLLGGAALAVGTFEDRETFVAPPDAVAETFVRSVMAGRWEPANELLESPLPEGELEDMRAEFGQRRNVEAETVTHDGTRALVTVRVPSRNVLRSFALRFDGVWKISPADRGGADSRAPDRRPTSLSAPR